MVPEPPRPPAKQPVVEDVDLRDQEPVALPKHKPVVVPRRLRTTVVQTIRMDSSDDEPAAIGENPQEEWPTWATLVNCGDLDQTEQLLQSAQSARVIATELAAMEGQNVILQWLAEGLQNQKNEPPLPEDAGQTLEMQVAAALSASALRMGQLTKDPKRLTLVRLDTEDELYYDDRTAPIVRGVPHFDLDNCGASSRDVSGFPTKQNKMTLWRGPCRPTKAEEPQELDDKQPAVGCIMLAPDEQPCESSATSETEDTQVWERKRWSQWQSSAAWYGGWSSWKSDAQNWEEHGETSGAGSTNWRDCLWQDERQERLNKDEADMLWEIAHEAADNALRHCLPPPKEEFL